MKSSIQNNKVIAPAAMLVFAVLIVACGTNSPTATQAQVQEIKADSPAEAVVENNAVQEKSSAAKMESNTAQNQTDPRIAVDADFEVRPLEEVFSSGPPEIVDLTGVDGSLVFVSDIPLACSVVYGETADYGMLTLDQDMNGGAHTDHHPLLLNLKPDTVYHYRLQGSAEDGTIYMSEDMTFRTPPAEETAEVNLASLEAGAQVVAASSNYGGAANDESWGANSALDGNRGTEWSSNGDGNNAFIEVALAQPSRLRAIEVWTRTMSNDTAQIFEFTITTDSGQVLGPFTLPDASQSYRFEVDTVASTLRLDVVDSNGGNTGLVEFAVYGSPVEN